MIIITFWVIRSTVLYPILVQFVILYKNIPFSYTLKRFNAMKTYLSIDICVLFD